MRHLPALLEIEELNAIQWTPGVGQPQGGDPCWYDLYKRIRAGGKAIDGQLGGSERAAARSSIQLARKVSTSSCILKTEHDIDRTRNCFEYR